MNQGTEIDGPHIRLHRAGFEARQVEQVVE
jgi:hypothetical protein